MTDGGGRRTRKRASLKEMADFAFDGAYKLRSRSQNLAAAGVTGYPRADDARDAAMFEDICDFLEAVRSLDGPAKNSIRQQIAANAQKKAEAAKAAGDQGHDRQGTNGEG